MEVYLRPLCTLFISMIFKFPLHKSNVISLQTADTFYTPVKLWILWKMILMMQ